MNQLLSRIDRPDGAIFVSTNKTCKGWVTLVGPSGPVPKITTTSMTWEEATLAHLQAVRWCADYVPGRAALQAAQAEFWTISDEAIGEIEWALRLKNEDEEADVIQAVRFVEMFRRYM